MPVGRRRSRPPRRRRLVAGPAGSNHSSGVIADRPSFADVHRERATGEQRRGGAVMAGDDHRTAAVVVEHDGVLVELAEAVRRRLAGALPPSRAVVADVLAQHPRLTRPQPAWVDVAESDRRLHERGDGVEVDGGLVLAAWVTSVPLRV